MKIRTITALAFVMISGHAFADSAATPGLQDAYQAHQQVVDQLRAGNLEEPAQKALNILVARGVSVLAESGNTELAAQFNDDWNTNYKNYLPTHIISDGSDEEGTVSILDIGDHDPISPWLANFHDTLKTKTSGLIDGFQIVQDIDTMNYALNVVLHPRSKSWKSGESFQADEWEYRKHFIPMANIITYWVTLESCDYVAATKAPAIKPYCSVASEKLEFYMGRTGFTKKPMATLKKES
jgi:hypothetical protein